MSSNYSNAITVSVGFFPHYHMKLKRSKKNAVCHKGGNEHVVLMKVERIEIHAGGS